MNANSNQPATAQAAKTNQYIARKTADACGIPRNSILCDGELIADCLLASDAAALAAKLNEHAALLAVAEAANQVLCFSGRMSELIDKSKTEAFSLEDSEELASLTSLNNALINLAAIRNQNGGKA